MIKTIRVSNLGPFAGLQEVSLPEGLISIEGRYVGELARSNRAGKTFFVTDLLSFALFGQHRFDTMEKIIHRNYTKSASEPVGVSVVLKDASGYEFALSRWYDNIAKRFTIDVPELGSIEQVSAMRQKELQESINSVLGCDYQHACLTWMVRQHVVGVRELGDGAGGIMDLSAPDRKQFLMDTFTQISYPWQAYYAEAMLRLKNYQTRLDGLESNLAMCLEKATKIDPIQIQADIVTYRGLRDEATEKVGRMEAQLAKLKEADVQTTIMRLAQEVSAASRKVGTVNDSISSSRRQIPVFEKMKAKVADARTQLAAVKDRLKELEPKVDVDKLQTLQQRYSEALRTTRTAEADLKASTSRYASVASFQQKGSVCPVTLKECAAGKDISAVIAQLEEQMMKHEGQHKVAEDAENRIKKQMDQQTMANNEYASLQDSFKVLGDIIDEGIGAESHIISINENLKKLTEELRLLTVEKDNLQLQLDNARATSVQQHQQQILTVEKRIIEAQRDAATHNAKIVELEGKMQYAKRLKDDIEAVQEEIRSVSDDVVLYKTLCPALSKDGVPFYALINSIAEFEYAVNRALHSLGSSIMVTVQPYTELNVLDTSCHTCGFTFITTKKNKCPVCNSVRQKKRRETLAIQFRGSSFNTDFNEDSGGGRLLVSLAIRLALFSTFKQRGMMDGVDFWVLDEVFSPLDVVHKNAMLQFLEELGNEYGLKQIFVISHTDISDIIPPTVIIERDAAAEYSTIVDSIRGDDV